MNNLYEIAKELEKHKLYQPTKTKRTLKHKLLIGFDLTPLGESGRF